VEFLRERAADTVAHQRNELGFGSNVSGGVGAGR
jgi:hypothetical protein